MPKQCRCFLLRKKNVISAHEHWWQVRFTNGFSCVWWLEIWRSWCGQIRCTVCTKMNKRFGVENWNIRKIIERSSGKVIKTVSQQSSVEKSGWSAFSKAFIYCERVWRRCLQTLYARPIDILLKTTYKWNCRAAPASKLTWCALNKRNLVLHWNCPSFCLWKTRH